MKKRRILVGIVGAATMLITTFPSTAAAQDTNEPVVPPEEVEATSDGDGVSTLNEPNSCCYEFAVFSFPFMGRDQHNEQDHMWSCYMGFDSDSPSIYSVNWDPRGDKVFVRDCEGDGWGVRARVYYGDGDGGPGAYTGLTIRDCCAKGDGGWKGRSDIQEHRNVYIKLNSYRDGDSKNEVTIGPYRTSRP